MILGMSPLVFVHVAISILGILTGFIAIFGMIAGQRLDGWTAVFLGSTLLTSLTGFVLPAHRLMPSHILGILSVLVLALAIPARYAKQLAGAWRKVYAVGACIALYLNVFVLVAQLFMKVPALHAMAPNGAEPPFLISQGTVLLVFIGLTIAATVRFRPESAHA